jgi:outer membrane protein assembly factor BamB
LRKPFLLLILALSTFLVLPVIPSESNSKPSQVLNPAPSGTTDYPWAMFHSDQFRDGVTAASGPASATLMWSYRTGNLVYPSPIIADGYVFIPSYDGTLYALDEYTGSLIWSFATGGNVYATPAIANGIVYVASKNGYIYALDEQTGGLIWRLANDNLTPVTSSPVVADGMVFYGTYEAPSCGCSEVLAVNAQSGVVVWRQYVYGDYVLGGASVGNGRIFIGAGFPGTANVIAYNETTGTSLWSYATGVTTSISATPAVASGRLYVGLDSSAFIALNQTTGGLVWSFPTPGGSNATSPAVNGGVVYFGTGAKVVYALNAATGAQIWTRTTGGAVTSSPALALGSNTLFVGSNDHYLYALNMATGAVLWRYLSGGQVSSSPAVADGRVFFGSKDQKVYALGAMLPKLYDTMASSVSVLEPGQNGTLTITIRNSTAPVSNVNLTLTSSAGGTLSLPVLVSPGTFQSNYTAPMISSTTLVVIQMTASGTGYLGASNQTSITVNPFPTLTVAVSPKPSSSTPGGEITLMIRVTNASFLISGASLQLSSTAGGSFYSVTDSGNGNYTAIFSTPLQASNPVVTVRASKTDFTTGQGQTTVAVTGVPNLTTLKVAGTSFFLLVAVGVVIFLLVLAVLVRRRKAEPHYPATKDVFNY